MSQGTPSDGDLKPVPSALVVAQGLPAGRSRCKRDGSRRRARSASDARTVEQRSEEHTSELQSLMRISYAVFCLKKKKARKNKINTNHKWHRDKQQSQHA